MARIPRTKLPVLVVNGRAIRPVAIRLDTRQPMSAVFGELEPDGPRRARLLVEYGRVGVRRSVLYLVNGETVEQARRPSGRMCYRLTATTGPPWDLDLRAVSYDLAPVWELGAVGCGREGCRRLAETLLRVRPRDDREQEVAESLCDAHRHEAVRAIDCAHHGATTYAGLLADPESRRSST